MHPRFEQKQKQKGFLKQVPKLISIEKRAVLYKRKSKAHPPEKKHKRKAFGVIILLTSLERNALKDLARVDWSSHSKCDLLLERGGRERVFFSRSSKNT